MRIAMIKNHVDLDLASFDILLAFQAADESNRLIVAGNVKY